MTNLTDTDFLKFQKLIYDEIGISLSEKKKSLVVTRLSKRLTFYNLNSYKEYYKLVLKDKSEFQIMLNLITTNETSFFREKNHFDYLKTILSFNKSEPLRIWSAACSNGAEPYSIAMLLSDTIKTKWEILATDINSDVLEYAKEAIYPMEYSKSIPEKYLKRYCLKGENKYDGFFKIKNSLKENITFMQLNLNNKIPNIGHFDIVFLRNVLIYFNNFKKKEVVENIAHHLKEDGLLIIGHSETLFNITDKYKMIKSTIYKKV